MYKDFIQALKAKYDLSNRYIAFVVDNAIRAIEWENQELNDDEYNKLAFKYIVEIFKDDGYTL